MPATFHRLGAGTAGDNSILSLPSDWRPNGTRTAVILTTGFGDTYTAALLTAAAQPVMAALNNAGYPVVLSDLGATASTGLWGNADAQARIGALRTYMQSAAVGAKTGKVFNVGFSMGALGALNYAGNNPANVAGIVVGCPVVDVQLVKDNAGYTAILDSAYSGGWTEATYGATTNPKTMANAGKYAGIPIRAYYAPDDGLISAASVTGFAGIVGAGATAVSAGNVGHSWNALINPTRLAEITAFFAGISA